MVLLKLKRQDKTLFQWGSNVTLPIAEIIESLVQLQNDRLYLERLISECEELIKYGPAKEVPGLSDEELGLVSESEGASKDTVAPADEPIFDSTGVTVIGLKRLDPTGRRIGISPVPEKANILKEVLQRATTFLAEMGTARFESKDVFNQIWDEIRGSIMIIWPEGLPVWDPVHPLLEKSADPTIVGILDKDTALLWWAGKCLGRKETLQTYVGRNEKTTIIVKLTSAGASAPVREPAVSEAEQRQMMAFYYKKQEEYKRMQEEADRNPAEAMYERGGSRLKEAFQGIPSAIRFK